MMKEGRDELGRFKKGYSWTKGKKVSQEIRDKISRTLTGRKNPEHSKRMSGRKISKETKMKMSKAQKRIGNKPPTPLIGNKNIRWKGGYENTLFLHRERRAMKLNAEGSHTLGEWELLKRQYGYTCPACGAKEPKIKLAADHIIPLSKGGSDYIENIQPLCKSCNSKKHTKIIKYNNV